MSACNEAYAGPGAMDRMATNHIRRWRLCFGGDVVVGWITLADLSRRLLVDNAALQAALLQLTEAE